MCMAVSAYMIFSLNFYQKDAVCANREAATHQWHTQAGNLKRYPAFSMPKIREKGGCTLAIHDKGNGTPIGHWRYLYNHPVLVPPLPRRHAIDIFKRPRKMQLVIIPHCISNIPYRKFRQL